MASSRVTWLGQGAGTEDDILPSVVETQPRSDGWTRSEKILFVGVLVNASFLLFQIIRSKRYVENLP